MRSGAQTVLVNITTKPLAGPTTMNEYREVTSNPAAQVAWKSDLWANMRGMRGGELSIARGVEANPTDVFLFDYYDVMTPMEGDATGMVLHEGMNFIVMSEDGLDLGTYDIDRIEPDHETRQSVRVLAVRKTLAV